MLTENLDSTPRQTLWFSPAATLWFTTAVGTIRPTPNPTAPVTLNLGCGAHDQASSEATEAKHTLEATCEHGGDGEWGWGRFSIGSGHRSLEVKCLGVSRQMECKD